jgi:hypothetical protein
MRIFCAIVLLSLAFGHQPASAFASAQVYDAVEADTADYRLPDGSFAGLCISGDADHPAHHPHGLSPCAVCLLSASFLLPVPDTASWLKTRFAWLGNSPSAENALVGRVAPGLPRSRGPPLPV